MFPPSHVWTLCRTVLHRLFQALLAVVLIAESAAAAPPGAIISNAASVEYTDVLNQPVLVSSNSVELIAAVVRSPSSIELTRVVTAQGSYQETVGPSACFSGGSYVPLADPVLVGGVQIDPTEVQEIRASGDSAPTAGAWGAIWPSSPPTYRNSSLVPVSRSTAAMSNPST